MDASTVSIGQLGRTMKHFVRRLLIIAGNRIELLTVEIQEERERFLGSILMALGVAALGLLAGLTLTAGIVILLWAYSPVCVLLTLAALYTLAAICLYRRLSSFLREWQTLPATLDQLKKDRACLEKILE
jgi:uncharacterized membrane protein YqjE